MAAMISSCSIKEGNYQELPFFGNKEITSFKFEHRYETSNSNGIPFVQIIGLATNGNVVNKAAFTVTIDAVVVPVASSTFTEAERTKLTLSNVIGIANISTGATIKPSDGGAQLGTFGNYSSPRKFMVTAADGTSQEWTVIVKSMVK